MTEPLIKLCPVCYGEPEKIIIEPDGRYACLLCGHDWDPRDG